MFAVCECGRGVGQALRPHGFEMAMQVMDFLLRFVEPFFERAIGRVPSRALCE